jgi:hypothetical protein
MVTATRSSASSSGKVCAPPEKENDAEVMDLIKKIRGSIGYVSSVYRFVFQLPDGTPNNYCLVCETLSLGTFIFDKFCRIKSD